MVIPGDLNSRLKDSFVESDDQSGMPLQGVANYDGSKIMSELFAGEDLANDVQKVEQRFSGLHVTADTLVTTGSGFLHTLTFAQTDAAPTAGTIIVYDNTAESGTILFSETFDTTVFRAYSVLLDVTFTIGLYVGFTTTADVGVTVSYR